MHAKTLLRTRGSTRTRLIAALVASVVGVASFLAFTAPTLAAPGLQPKTTHPVEGRENCLMCHQVGGGPKPSPASHASYTNATCLGCHPAGQAAPAAEPKPETQPARPAAIGTPSGSEAPQSPASSAPAPAASPAPVPSAGGAPGPAAPAAAPAAPACLDCHKNPSLSMELPGGEKLSLYVDEAEMANSVHQGKLGCTDCHTRITGYPHKKVEVNTRREYSVAEYEACKRCHFANYTKTLDSIHYKTMESGDLSSPLCTDCHGYHNVSRPDEPRSKISTSCAKCHADVYTTYTRSVHGAALLKDENPDVPVCTDCHGTHTIKDPTGASFRLSSPEMCARCHADEALMRKYNLSPNVFKTYIQDFHGATVALTKRQGPDNWTNKAVCSDCHGVHNIQSVKNGDPTEIKRNMVATCQKCHPDAGTNFPDAWLSHYEVSPTKAPLPWAVRAWYVVFIPFMIGGLMLHIVVDLWRIARNR